MKKTILLLGCLLAASPVVFGQTHYLDDLKLENQNISKSGDKVTISADIIMNELELSRQKSLRLVPVIVSADGTQQLELTPILLEGKVRHKVTERKLALGTITDEEEIMRIRRENGKEQNIEYNTEVPFSRWMVNGRLELRGYITGCAECSEGDEVLTAGNVLPYSEPVFTMVPAMKPAEETVKRRAEDKSARLEYRRDSYAVLPEYRSNRAELDSVQHSLALVKDNPNLTITGIYITGYLQRHNRELKKELWHVAWKGEDWEGFVSQVDKAEGWSARTMVKEAIAQCDNNTDACEWKIRRQLSADDYRYLLDELYAPLRRNDYRIEYNVRNFTLDEAKQMLESRPDLLSAAEMQRIADSYGNNTDGYRKALDTALKIYPDNTAIRYNAALAEVETENYLKAIALLKDTQDAASLNLLGIAYFKSGNKHQAEQAFRNAAAAGYTEAEQHADNVRLSIEMLGE